MSDTDDIEATGSQTKQMRAVKTKLREDEIRAEYEAKEQAKLADSVSKLWKHRDTDDRRISKLEWWVAAVKWGGGAFLLAVVGVIVKLVFGD